MPETDGVDDALRTTTQTLAALLARHAQQRAIRREHQARQRQFDLERANARIAAEHAMQSIQTPQFTIAHGIGPDAPRQQITKQEALDRINWTEEDRHQFTGRIIRGNPRDIRSWIGLDNDVDTAIAERYPHLMTDQQRATVRNAQLAADPDTYRISTGGHDIAITKQTALDIVEQRELQPFQQTSIPSWIGRDRDIDRAIHRNHPELMTPTQLARQEASERNLTEALQKIERASQTAKRDPSQPPDLEPIRRMIGTDPELDHAIYQYFPDLLPDKIKREQLIGELYPLRSSSAEFTTTHRTQNDHCERRFTKTQTLERIDDSAAMLAPGGYFDQQQATRGIAAQTERDQFTAQRIIEFREWAGRDPDIDQLLHETFPKALNDRQLARLKILQGEHHYPNEPKLAIQRDRLIPAKLTEPDAIGVIERRATTLQYIEPGPTRNRLIDEIRDMIGQTPTVDQAIDRNFPELMDPAARINMQLAGPPKHRPETATPTASTTAKMRQAEAQSLYPADQALSDNERQRMQQVLDKMAITPAEIKTDPTTRDGRTYTIPNQEFIHLQFDLHKYIGRELATDHLIHQHQPETLTPDQTSRMRAADALLHAKTQTHTALATGNPKKATQLENLAATTTGQGDDLGSDADRDWDTAKKRAARAQLYDTCGNHQAAAARKLSDTTQATPPWKALTARTKNNKTSRHRHATAGRRLDRNGLNR